MASSDDRAMRIQEIREALQGGDERSQRAALDNERVRIATVLLRFGKSVADPHVMVDALLAAVSQTVAEHEIDSAAVQDDFVAFLAAAQQDLADRRGAPPLDLVEPTGSAAPTRKPN